ncbi:antitoxin Xre/MbcA/ParS toxin-binding domain-containing protein [Enterobacterales bacterium BD_CKDN230030183-1A_HGKHYDSX7]
MNSMPPGQNDYFSQVFSAAQRLYGGNVDAARHWMRSPVRGLGGKSPASMLTTREETDRVLDYIARLEHGIVC